jgi:hypothetical protein
MKLQLPQVTLLGIDCVHIERLQAALTASQRDIDFGAVKLLTSLPTDDARLVTIPHIDSIEEFSRFCVEDLTKYVDTDYVLLVQYDGFVLSADRWDPDFLNYDYIGAPLETSTWTPMDPAVPIPKYIVGNGGFCLRSKKFLDLSAQFVKEGIIANTHPEDVVLSYVYKEAFEKEGMKYAPVEVAMRFSVHFDDGEYVKPFGFHGFYQKNLETLVEEHPQYPVKYFLPRIRWARLQRIKKAFQDTAIEGQYFGSMGRGTPDLYSDIDIWLTFKDENMEAVLEKRFEYYAQAGDIIHICEAPQNSPIGGMYSFVLYKTAAGLLAVDYYLCPQSASFTTKDNRKLFGELALPIGEIEFNPHKRVVSETYRIDFLITIAFGAIKKLYRQEENALALLTAEYKNLRESYGIEVQPLHSTDNSPAAFAEIIENVRKVSTGQQQRVLDEISRYFQALSFS